MNKAVKVVAGLWTLLGATTASAQLAELPEGAVESPRTAFLEFKLGTYLPELDSEAGLEGQQPFNDVFGEGSILLFEVEGERQLFQDFGSAAIGFSAGYGEKFGRGSVRTPEGGLEPASESAGLRVVPLRLLGIYRFDWGAQEYGIPLVPYVKAGLVAMPWFITEGTRLEQVDGRTASGVRWGYQGTLGLSLQLDFLDRRMARDFDSGLGVNHSYLFAEYTAMDVTSFGQPGFVFSDQYFMFGLGLEY